MSTSQHAFNQVKSILGKLERDIDQARQKRLRATGTTAAAPIPAPAVQPTEHVEDVEESGNGRSGYGMARPLRHPNEQ